MTAMALYSGIAIGYALALFTRQCAERNQVADIAREAQSLEADRAPRVIGMTDAELALWAERHGRVN